MKKIVGTIAAAALVASAAFAEVSVSNFGRGVFSPVSYNDANGKIETVEQVSWGGATRAGITMAGSSENAGFVVDFNFDGAGAGGCNDNSFVWAKPFDFLQIKVGSFKEDQGRGNFSYGGQDLIRRGLFGTGDDVTFTRIRAVSRGASVVLTPVEGLWVVAAVDANNTAETTYGNKATYAAGYTIADIATIKAALRTADNAKDYEGTTLWNATVEVAADVVAVENLSLSVGAQIPMGLAALSSGKPANQVRLSASANYNLDAVTFHAYVIGLLPNEVKSSKDDTVTAGGKVECGVGADIDLGDGLSLGADLRYATAQDGMAKTKVGDKTYEGTQRQSASQFAAAVYVGKSLSSGNIKAGVQMVSDNVVSGNDEAMKVNFDLPISITTYF